MPRAKNKADLLESAQSEFVKLTKLIDTMPKEMQSAEFCFEGRDRNVRDVLIHLYEWHLLLLHFVNINTDNFKLCAAHTNTNHAHTKSSTKPPISKSIPFLPPPYNWKTYPKMNKEIWKKHQNTSLEKSKQLLKQSHNEVLKTIEQFNNEELFTKKLWSWCGSTHLGSYYISAAPSHYVWAIKLLKKHTKSVRI
ncbi:hypothetical protein CCZ01_06365 [Helicobacter monodelphidis]|uniref:ClbS/DfsB family four-helix bundle protein n=1 Tax=Helicobacter sp. 15-1451 TaxID=2004995 RepID=UPI000DCBC974|nr:ClbS/DfsB family four-helix bundle protein [Helicobacter sp. 15-1451]RAX57320.1 hypothetical protein CCZ01_06365 [Helicobacter sp. 15-1451]